MGAMKRYAEQISVAMGGDGEITDITLGYAQHALNLKEACLKEPLTIKQMQEQVMSGEGVSGVVSLRLAEIIVGGVEDFDDALSNKLVGSTLLHDVVYNLVGIDPLEDVLYFRVEGDASGLLEDAADAP
jgi:hypothetical protein